MNIYNGNVYASPSENTGIGRQILAENPDHPGSLGVAISEAMEEALANDEVKYTLGSVLTTASASSPAINGILIILSLLTPFQAHCFQLFFSFYHTKNFVACPVITVYFFERSRKIQ